MRSGSPASRTRSSGRPRRPARARTSCSSRRPTSEAEIEALPRRLDRPLLFNYAPSGRSPLLPFARLRALGYAIVIVPVDLLFVATRAMQRALAELRDRDARCRGIRSAVASFQEFCDLIGLPEQLALGQRY